MLYESARLRLEGADQVATLWLGAAGQPSNTLTLPLLLDMERAFKVVQSRPFISVLLVRSQAASDFLTGPDLDEIDALATAHEWHEFMATGCRVLSRLRALSPNTATVAFVDGRCANAGLELALACDYRLAVARPETLIGYDGLQRGLFPCWGLTQSLSAVIGPRRTLDLLLTGQLLPARAARQVGLVDHAFGPRPAKTELWSFLADLQDHPREPGRRRRRRSWRELLTESSLLCGPMLFRSYERRWPRRDQRQVLSAVERGWRCGAAAGAAVERAGVLALANDSECRARREIARRREQLRQAAAAWPNPGRIGIVGMNQLGIELALLALRFGGTVHLQDTDATARAWGLSELERGLHAGVEQGWFTIVEAEQKRKAVTVSATLGSMAKVGMVFVAEEPQVQARVMATLDTELAPEVTLVATAPLPRAVLRRLKHPERTVGIRFEHSPLEGRGTELIPGPRTSPATCGRLARWLDHCGKWVDGVVPSAAADPAVFAA